jgi:transcriptional regulator with XRE-family HTH domain
MAMDIRKRIGWNLRRLRNERDITQEDFATDSGFDRGYISGVERGVRNPSVVVLARIADALGVDISELFNLEMAREFSVNRRA